MHAVPTLFNPEITTGIVICFEEVSEGVCLSHCFLTGYLPIQKQLLENLYESGCISELCGQFSECFLSADHFLYPAIHAIALRFV